MTGRSDIEDALRRLDKLTREEHRMASAQGLRATHDLGEKVIDGARFFVPSPSPTGLLNPFFRQVPRKLEENFDKWQLMLTTRSVRHLIATQLLHIEA